MTLPATTPVESRRRVVPPMATLLAPSPAAARLVAATPVAGCDVRDLAGPGEERCGYQPGRLRCVRRPHPESPDAHVRVSAELAAPPADQVLLTPRAVRRTAELCAA